MDINVRLASTILLAILLPLGSAFAHNPLNHPEWCERNGRLVIVDELNWRAEDLIGRNSETCTPEKSGSRTCGQFDDDWIRGNMKALNHCRTFERRYSESNDPDHGTVIFVPSGPESFLDERNHHRNYKLSDGLSGSCVRCDPNSRPIPLRR